MREGDDAPSWRSSSLAVVAPRATYVRWYATAPVMNYALLFTREELLALIGYKRPRD